MRLITRTREGEAMEVGLNWNIDDLHAWLALLFEIGRYGYRLGVVIEKKSRLPRVRFRYFQICLACDLAWGRRCEKHA